MHDASASRYSSMQYNRCGKSGLKLPAVSLGLWHNFGDTGVYERMKEMCFTAFDNGITHFDLANNYGPSGRLAPERPLFPQAEFRGRVGDDRIYPRIQASFS